MNDKVLTKGNEALAEGAIIAGCRYYFGYPITPQSEVPEYLAKRMPKVDGVFLQAESELAAANMVMGAASAGARVMTSSSGPGISLKMETVSSLAAAELPCVIVNVMRAGPGVGTIQGSQADYFQATKGGGHGDYRLLVYAPNSVQEMMDLIILAFEKADEYQTPAMLLCDGATGQMMEPIVLPEPKKDMPPKPWALTGAAGREPNTFLTLKLEPADCEAQNIKLQAKYQRIVENESRWQEMMTDDADLILVSYGMSSRIAITIMQKARSQGLKIGLFRPITLFPYPYQPLADLADKCKAMLVIEQSAGQMVEDVRLAVNGKIPVEFHGRMGGTLPDPEEVLDIVIKMSEKFKEK
ncbi:MAG: 3-methyl-2-oxobutanoate dehydrogenase subunit VorB [Desulfarculales bacterium]|jgi:2-oxoglutarate ferredoxin oxidoreductase subunit alpha|nr:3-methyl-2-oxobutanoate dehydrogenase subunit VorB [Desulfarculales bacterium]